MAISNHDRITRALELLTAGLVPFIERELKSEHSQHWFDEITRTFSPQQLKLFGNASAPQWDAASALQVMWDSWTPIFKKTLGHGERSLVSELRETRNKWAHQRAFSSDDVYRALDSAQRLLGAISAVRQTGEIETMKQELMRTRYEEQVRNEKRKSAPATTTGELVAGLKPWREIITPHKDVAQGNYQQAEFAADLWQVAFVHDNTVAPEYKHPVEFFKRTFLTQSLRELLVGAIRRLSGAGGDPVVQLQTNFGGGKTHSMLALYHLFSGLKSAELPGLETVFEKANGDELPRNVKRVVLVGNRISPGNPVKKDDGTIVRTLWGEIAWQLGGKEAYAQIRQDDENATSPGDRLRDLFNQYGPCLILIDEWVAYARQLHEQNDLPGGSFETHFTFAQTLTECAKTAAKTLLVVSLPSSDTAGSPHIHGDDLEVGGERGRVALDRLRNAVGRLESSWKPASAEEGFEIVRRRLFEPLSTNDDFIQRDTTAREFSKLYRAQHQEFPSECGDIDYEKRIRAAYPIHPEIFDRLYTDWSTLVKFQRTRGVLRLMAVVIHSLWKNGDKNPLILPAHLPIDEPRVQTELTRYLSDNWTPIIEKDVDGPHSLPLRIDGEQPNLGKYSACRRVARAIYLGSAPTAGAANKGLEDRRIKLGCVMPGESPAVFGDAMRRLSSTATYLYQDGSRYWYSTQPTVTKLAEDRAEQYKTKLDEIADEIKKRVRIDVRDKADFNRVHDFPANDADIPDDTDARLVVLGTTHLCTKDADCDAIQCAKHILEHRGHAPRLNKNTLVFLAADKARMADLDEATRRYLAWQTIVDEAEALDLTPHQKKQAVTQRDNASNAVNTRLPEAYQWLIVPQQAKPQDSITWQQYRLTGQDPLAMRASKKLKNDGALAAKLGATLLRRELDRIPLWRGNGQHVEIKTLTEDFARYLYLQRLRDTSVLIDAICDGVSLTSWDKETFAYAEAYDEKNNRYSGLKVGTHLYLPADGFITGILVRPDIAQAQIDLDRSSSRTSTTPPPKTPAAPTINQPTTAPSTTTPSVYKHFYGTVKLNPERMLRDAEPICKEIVQHLTALLFAKVEITLEIQANVPDQFPLNVIRTIKENCESLKFKEHDFSEQ